MIYQKSLNGGRPGLVVVGRVSCLEGGEFEPQHLILNRQFPHLFVVKIVVMFD